MKSFQNIIFILAATLFLQGCIASKPNSSRKSLSSSVKNTGTTTTGPTFTSDEAMYWFTSLKINGTITLNKNTDSIVYLRGQSVHSFLTSKDSSNTAYYQNGKQFCLVATYGGTYKQLRLRAVPIFISNYTTKSIERLFRIDVPSKDENFATCGLATISGVAPSAAAYSLPDICPSCLATTLITSTSLNMFEVNIAASTMNALNSFPLTPVKMRIDMQSNSTSNESACTNSACEAKGFDCCVEGQCVKDASIKSSATSDPQYSQAMSDYAVNPLNFINYPNIFNICSNISHTPPPTTTPGTTPQSEAEKRVAQYLSDYQCIEKFQTDGLYSLCLPGAGETDYNAVKKRLAIACGCPSTYSPNEMAIKCPDWGVRPLYKSSVQTIANIVDFYCYTPVPENPIGPITNLNVNVSSRSAPHRFYSTTGANYDDIGKLASSIVQEGEDFYYLDDLNKNAPVNGSYNINSILGRMTVGLTQTQPAKMVDVELGKTYIVSATSGYFTPCSQCAKDSWFQSFTAHPSSLGGNGLVASGFTTSRDTYSANTTFGNYEDTKFGRACYLPVTMLPLAHKKESTLIDQRKNRLTTQATYYVNGYQRDWFGFNKGALIGSFDGVTWFAVGSGRRISATSTKLYLAINGAYLDLADRTDTIVNIIPDISANVAADYDFDPTIALNDPKQNKAGTCQQYHQCSTDSDCVAQLGWEYMCADVSQLRTNWPIYDTEAKEVSNQSKTGTIFEILQGTVNPGNSSKRCVYRGAGAPCVRDFTALNDNFNQKNLTCAPNFYCAALTTNRFNDEVARSPNEFDNILFGMDTNVLGRPLKYVTANKNLTAEAIANIKANGTTVGLTTAQVDDMGICRPGKSLSTNAATAHSNPDTSRRTDYMSQVGSCNSTITNSTRVSSCPAFNDDGDYLPYNSITPWPDDYKRQQNACGAESKDVNDLSAFRTIEGGALQILQNITQPILAADACLRRAGSVCFTDLDCGPNKLHEETASSMALSYFGGTEAEQSYWKESLICGQGAATPQLGSATYYDYKLSENRCCREIGKDFTMYTSGPATIVPENMGTNVNLVTSRQSIDNPRANYRYSRYSISKSANEDPTMIPSVSATAEPAREQWKVINETGSRTCCGGGWIRKFADGTHNWKKTDRLSLETSNFSCLNYRSPLVDSSYNGFGNALDKIVQSSYQREYEYFCKFPSNDGCMQILYRDITDFALLPPTPYNPSLNEQLDVDDQATFAPWSVVAPYLATGAYQPTPASGYTRLETTPVGDLESGNYSYNLNSDVPYVPFAFTFSSPPYDLYIYPDSGKKEALRFFIDKDLDYGVSLYLPAYIPYDTVTRATPTIGAIYVKYIYDNDVVEVVNITNLKETDNTKCDGITNYAGGGQPVDVFAAGNNEAWCISSTAKSQNRPVLHVKAFTGPAATFPARQWKYASVIIDFMPLERFKNTPVSNPGNMYYYLTKLGRLELIGIPQITYEPIYCNNNQNNLVPGIFTSTIKTRAQFTAASQVYSSFDPIVSYAEEGVSEGDITAGYGNSEKRFTYQDKLGHQAIFSSKEFACCTPLGKEPTSEDKCCSGTAATVNGKLTCKLPTGTDLNVYFNKFVSGEGVGEDLPGNGLTLTSDNPDDVDFHEFTGEPKLRARTNDKIMALGKAFCKSGVVGQGGAFGQFGPEPYSTYEVMPGTTPPPFPFSIVDSIVDRDDDNFAGKMAFDAGFRWDHHFYCK